VIFGDQEAEKVLDYLQSVKKPVPLLKKPADPSSKPE